MSMKPEHWLDLAEAICIDPWRHRHEYVPMEDDDRQQQEQEEHHEHE